MAQFSKIWDKHTKLKQPGDENFLNADFGQVWRSTKVFEGGYQAMPKDPANYCPAKGKPGSALIGTNHGVSAIGMAHYIKRCPTVQEMKSLSSEKAMQVAKNQYWNPIQGDKIKSQAVAHFIFDFTYGGSAGPLQARQTINTIKGKDTVKEFKSFNLSDKEIEHINSIPEKTFLAELYKKRLNYYKGHTYETGLTNRLNKLKDMYAQGLEVSATFAKNNVGKILLVSAVLGIGLYLILRKK